MLTNCSTTLKKTTSIKRASLPRLSDFTKQFTKDWTRLSHSGRYDMKRLKEAMLLLIANDQPLGPEWLDHALIGDWIDHRECHVGGDFLLIYRLDGSGSNEKIIFVRAGSHADLFEWIRTDSRISRRCFDDCFEGDPSLRIPLRNVHGAVGWCITKAGTMP